MTDQELRVREKQEAVADEQTRPGRSYIPDVDIYETADALHVRADVPGVDDKSVQVDLDDRVLTIEGRMALEEYQNLSPVYTEYNVGNWVRRFTVSDAIDPERIEARIVHGVLELTLPKSERAKPKRIAVTVQ